MKQTQNEPTEHGNIIIKGMFIIGEDYAACGIQAVLFHGYLIKGVDYAGHGISNFYLLERETLQS